MQYNVKDDLAKIWVKRANVVNTNQSNVKWSTVVRLINTD